ncbi:c-terminal peptidase (Prc) [Lachnospiraceae bacterium CAG:25]|nr:c-terminal peptidase (Prc) [Lachnospiraceae bacterium CAG:25]
MKKFSKILVGLLVVVCIVEGFFLYRAYAIPSTTLQTARKINRIEQIIDKYYKGSVKKSELEDCTYKGLVAGLGDVYSTYYSEDDFKELEQSTSGVYYGVGIYLTQDIKTGIITVVKPVKGSPADGSGLKKGDILTKVGNYKLKTSDALDDIVKKIKGAEGTKVKLTFTRNQTSKTYTFTRQSIENPTVETKMLQDKVGYLQITEFDEVTVSQFRSGLKSLKKQGAKKLIIDLRDNPGGLLTSVVDIAGQIQGAKKLIIDLRDNPGGLLTSVVDIAGQILPKGTIVYTEDKNGNKKYYKDTKNEQLDMPLCVLVNGNSASAAEILSGAIKDDKAGTLVGETTFGKGIVQGFFEVGDGSYVKLTYSSYYTPAGHNIHKKGIKPDVEVKDNTKTKADEQLNKALSILQKK